MLETSVNIIDLASIRDESYSDQSIIIRFQCFKESINLMSHKHNAFSSLDCSNYSKNNGSFNFILKETKQILILFCFINICWKKQFNEFQSF
jgi:hypothetical protein